MHAAFSATVVVAAPDSVATAPNCWCLPQPPVPPEYDVSLTEGGCGAGSEALHLFKCSRRAWRILPAVAEDSQR